MRLFHRHYLAAIVDGVHVPLAELQTHDAAQLAHVQRSAVDGNAVIELVDLQLSKKRVVMNVRIVFDLAVPQRDPNEVKDLSNWDKLVPNPNAVDDDGLPQGFRK